MKIEKLNSDIIIIIENNDNIKNEIKTWLAKYLPIIIQNHKDIKWNYIEVYIHLVSWEIAIYPGLNNNKNRIDKSTLSFKIEKIENYIDELGNLEEDRINSWISKRNTVEKLYNKNVKEIENKLIFTLFNITRNNKDVNNVKFKFYVYEKKYNYFVH